MLLLTPNTSKCTNHTEMDFSSAVGQKGRSSTEKALQRGQALIGMKKMFRFDFQGNKKALLMDSAPLSGIDSTDQNCAGRQNTSVVLKPPQDRYNQVRSIKFEVVAAVNIATISQENTLYLVTINPSDNSVKLFPNLDFQNHSLALYLEGSPLPQVHCQHFFYKDIHVQGS